jgi:hypothetical protein
MRPRHAEAGQRAACTQSHYNRFPRAEGKVRAPDWLQGKTWPRAMLACRPDRKPRFATVLGEAVATHPLRCYAAAPGGVGICLPWSW